MTTSDASFDSFELQMCEYIANNVAMDGQVVSPWFNDVEIALSKTDPRAGIIYPNKWASSGTRNATYEPTVAEWDAYSRVRVLRSSVQWEVYVVAGVTKWRNLNDIVFPAVGATTASGGSPLSLPYAVWCFRGGAAFTPHAWGTHVAELDSPISITGVGAGPTIPALNLVFEFR